MLARAERLHREFFRPIHSASRLANWEPPVEGVSVILDLIDQIHGLRRTLRVLLSAICEEPKTTRRQVVTRVRKLTL